MLLLNSQVVLLNYDIRIDMNIGDFLVNCLLGPMSGLYRHPPSAMSGRYCCP